MENKYTNEDLKTMQAWSLQRKVQVTQTRIIEWYQHFNGQVYISFSGGKDSTVLLDLARRIYADVPAVFVNTGLEYPEIVQFVKTFDNVTMLRPEMNFKKVIEKCGYPLISKEVAHRIYYYRKGSNWAVKYIDGTAKDDNGNKSRYCVAEKWKKLINSEIPISSRCCDIMKKAPVHKYERKAGKKPIIATMASESALRKQKWIQRGCNAFDSPHQVSTPMSFWTEQDVLQYIKEFDIPYASVYGDIVQDGNGKYYTTKLQRTGCVFCGFGAHLEKEPNRFQRLQVTHPKLWNYCMKPWEEGGLGMKPVLEYIGVKTEGGYNNGL